MIRSSAPPTALLLLLTGLVPCPPTSAEEKKTPLRRNSLDDWGTGFSDCLERHTKGVAHFASAYRKQREDAPETLDYVLGVESPLRKVFKDKLMFHGRYEPEIRILAARDEYEAVQVCVIPAGNEKALKGVKLSVTDLEGAGHTLQGNDVEISVIEYIQPEPVEYPVAYKGPWPDPLIPQREINVEIPPLELRPFWVEIHVPRDAEPGDYQGELTVTTANSHSLAVPLKLHVWDFAIPDEVHLPIDTRLRPNRFTVSGDPEKEDAAWHRYVEFFLRHRINVGPACTVPVAKDPDYAKLDRELEWAFSRGMTSFPLRFRGKDEKKRKEFVALCDHLREKGWLKYARIQVGIDEPNVEHYAKTVEHAKDLKSLAPDLTTWATESPHPDLIGHVDVFGSDICTERPEWNRMAKEAGAKILYSMCHIPVRAQLLRPQQEAPNMILDVPAVYHRVVYWLAWANEIDGLSFWGGNCEWPKGMAKTWPEEPMPPKWKGDWVYSGIHNGNGITVYPGRNGHPWASLRMKVIRDGSEDYEYLWVLRELLKKTPKRPRFLRGPRKQEGEELEGLLDPVPEVCVSPTYFSHAPDAILRRRAELGHAIDSLTK